MSNKKIVSIVVVVIMFVAAFVAGYFLSDKIFPQKDDETTVSQEDTTAEETTAADSGDEADKTDDDDDEYVYIATDEVLGEGEIKVSKAEYTYYCASVYSSFVSTAFQYDYYYGEGYGAIYTEGFEWKIPPSEQKCNMEVDGKTFDTYADYIEFLATQQLLSVKAFAEYARLNSITLDEQELAEVDAVIEQNRESVSQNNMDIDEYLKLYFGEGMTEELFKEIVKEQYLVNKIDEIKSGIYEDAYTDEILENKYNANIRDYGTVTLRNYVITAETDSSTGKVTADSMKAAKSSAEIFASVVTDEKSFKQRASEKERQLGNESYTKLLIEDRYTLLKDAYYDELVDETGDNKAADWAFSAERKTGETYIAEVADVGYVVYMMVEPVHKPSPEYTYDVRHILLQPGEDDTSSGSAKIKLLNPSDYSVNVDIDIYSDTTANPALYMKAQGILEEYLGGACTEDSFAELAKQYSSDGNAAQGGIYEDVTEGQMVSAFENWALEKDREYGDVGIVETEYGYHIMFFVGREVVSEWNTQLREELVYADVLAFNDALMARYTLGADEVDRAELNKCYNACIEHYKAFMG